jgi:pyruvate dehydrogenase E1 component beta subunit
MAKVTLIEAVTMALAYEMEHDDSVIVLGEDVGVNGGVFRATAGLQQRFGPDRVMDTPLAEAMIAGASIGMAAQGMKPVCEMQFMGFIYPAVDQMINHAGRMRHRTRGRLHCPMVLRAPFGGGIHAPEHHSESTEALFAHMPGIRVVIPSSPQRAYGLLLAAIRDPDPVVFLEPKRIYRLQKQEVPDDGRALPLDVCYTLREGDDVTLVTWGAMTFETLKAATALAEEGVSCEVIDVATISPLDLDTILESVEKTGRLVIVHEAARNCGVGAEIAAGVAEKGLYDLEAPIQRVTGYDTVMPLFRMEYQYLPSVQRIVDAAKATLED